MWARVVEIMFGFWLLMSPLVFRFDETINSVNDLICGFLVIAFGFLSFWKKTAFAHFLQLFAALWLIAFGYFAGYPSPPSAQNQIIVGLMLGMFAIIPNDTDELPSDWEKFYAGENGE